jgi:hypothetical protein
MQQPLLSNTFANKHVPWQQLDNNEERCFLCGACRDVMSGTSWERALPGNLQNRRYSFMPPPPPNVVSLTTSPHFFLILSLSLSKKAVDSQSVDSWLVSEWVRGLPGLSRCEPLVLESGIWGRGPFGNPEKRERPPLEAATKQRQWGRDCGHKCA